MLKIYQDSKIYIYCPAGVVTGGAELLHQLADKLNRMGRHAYLVYFGNTPHDIPEAYKRYEISIAEEIEECEKNIVVVYEGIFEKSRETKRCQKFLWWLSVDHFYMVDREHISLRELFRWNPALGAKEWIKRWCRLCGKQRNRSAHPITFAELISKGDMHGYQSEYAQYFLQGRGVKNLCALKDYINTEHFGPINTQGRENVVLYNPKKGWEFTRKLIQAAPDIVWKPLIDMTRAEIITTMQSSKVYIDFGYHPGKDRLPREAAMNGLCVITGYKGSANFFEDVAIDSSYKFHQHNRNIPEILTCIRETMAAYEERIKDFQYYRDSIRREKAEFEAEIEHLFQVRY